LLPRKEQARLDGPFRHTQQRRDLTHVVPLDRREHDDEPQLVGQCFDSRPEVLGALLTSLVVAREWERGTIEALFVTPIRPGEILLGKTIPYFALGMIGFALCVLSAKFLFHVPLRGSLLVLTGVSMLYLLVALALGLLISSALKSQFVASQITLLVTFLPAVMLSGFLFDLRSLPAAVQLVTFLLPARYYVTLLQTIFLVGDVWAVIVPNAAVLAAMMTVLLWLARRATRKQLA